MKTTREQWLEQATDLFRSGLFSEQGAKVPPVRVSVGFTGSRHGNKAIGVCWNAAAAADGVAQVYISPIIDDGLRALDILVHELVHAVLPGAGHGPEFRKLAVAVGLTGKMTATTASDALKARCQTVIDQIGAYPHSALNPGLSGIKKQSTRLRKCVCLDCGYTVRVTTKWLETGSPICPCNGESMMVH